MTVAVVVSRRLPVVAAAIPALLPLALSPEMYHERLVAAQLMLGLRLGRRTARTATGLLFFVGVCTAGLVPVAVTDTSLTSWSRASTTAVLTVLLPWLVGRYLRQRDELIRTGWELAERMEHERDLAGERERLRERSRIARDVHDSVGHELSLIALQAGAIEVDRAAGQAARRAAAELRAAAARATGCLQEVIGVLRDDADAVPMLPANDTVGSLIERAVASGMQVTVVGELPPLLPLAARAAYRVVQESLTNAAKHAPGSPVEVRLVDHLEAGEAVVTVANEISDAPRPANRSGGLGLAGLDERVRMSGGRLDLRRADGVFELTARLPSSGPEADAGSVGDG
jgi:signal transduction histidine kinase